MNDSAKELLDFLNASPTCYHAVKNLADKLDSEGYIRLNECETWKLSAGKKYYTVRGGSALISFRIPLKKPASF